MKVIFFSETEFETPDPVEYKRPYHIKGTQITVIFQSETEYEIKGGEIEFDAPYEIESKGGWKLTPH